MIKSFQKKFAVAILILSLGAMFNHSIGQAITSYGTGAGTTGTNGSYFGENAGRITTGESNTFFGENTGYSNTTGRWNVYLGARAGYLSTGERNVFVGAQAGYNNTSGGWNTFVGHIAGTWNTTGMYNVFLGGFSGYQNASGIANIVIGYQAGFNNVNGSKNIFIGTAAGYNELGSNRLYISNNSTSTPLIYGEFDSNKLVFNGQVGVATSNFPSTLGSTNLNSYKLFVKGGILAEEIRVRTGWADYVFEEGYVLKPLSEVELYIKENGHLPNVPSARVVEEEGLELGNIVKIQQEKIEELTLYIIDQEKRFKKEIEDLKALVVGSVERDR
ncbi:hypothetical protein GCM10023091_19630 [Ravibacter arvi]|uniref:TMF family protein n=1 Tax=Ravibacter arvi TaxID=2051041 RepID=A0ABP8LZE9_9BACT